MVQTVHVVDNVIIMPLLSTSAVSPDAARPSQYLPADHPCYGYAQPERSYRPRIPQSCFEDGHEGLAVELAPLCVVRCREHFQ